MVYIGIYRNRRKYSFVAGGILKKDDSCQIGNHSIAVDAILDQLIFSADELKSMGKILTYSIYMYKDEPIGVIVSSNNKDDLATIEYYNVVNDDKQYIKFSSSILLTVAS